MIKQLEFVSPICLHTSCLPTMSDTKCRVCGRTLSNPKSIAKGVGQECDHHATERLQLSLLEETFDKESERVLKAMEERTLELQKIKCPGCGYKCLKPVSWTKAKCIVCELSHNKHIFDL